MPLAKVRVRVYNPTKTLFKYVIVLYILACGWAFWVLYCRVLCIFLRCLLLCLAMQRHRCLILIIFVLLFCGPDTGGRSLILYFDSECGWDCRRFGGMIVSGHVKAWFAIPIACSCVLFGLSFVIFDIFKWILFVVGVFLVAAPVYDIIVAYKASEPVKTSALFLLVATANAVVWLIYGIIKDLIILIAVNGTGLAFIIIESIVIVVYNGQLKDYRQIQMGV